MTTIKAVTATCAVALVLAVGNQACAAENQVLECTVHESNGKAYSRDKGQVVSMPLSNFTATADGVRFIYENERQGESFVVSRKTGEFDWVIGASNSRFARNEPARMSGSCTLKTEKLKF